MNVEKEFQALQPHPKYYIPTGDVCFQVDHISFRVHRYFLERDSQYFHAKLNDVIPPGGKPPGATDATAIVLDQDGIDADKFARLLWVFYNPQYSIYEETADTWSDILFMSHLWRFRNVKDLAVRELEKKHFSDVKRIRLYLDNDVDRNLLIPCYARLCARDAPLSLQEGRELGMEVALQIAAGREEVRAAITPSGARSPLTPTVSGKDLDGVIRKLFEIDEPRAPSSVPETPVITVVKKPAGGLTVTPSAASPPLPPKTEKSTPTPSQKTTKTPPPAQEPEAPKPSKNQMKKPKKGVQLATPTKSAPSSETKEKAIPRKDQRASDEAKLPPTPSPAEVVVADASPDPAVALEVTASLTDDTALVIPAADEPKPTDNEAPLEPNITPADPAPTTTTPVTALDSTPIFDDPVFVANPSSTLDSPTFTAPPDSNATTTATKEDDTNTTPAQDTATTTTTTTSSESIFELTADLFKSSTTSPVFGDFDFGSSNSFTENKTSDAKSPGSPWGRTPTKTQNSSSLSGPPGIFD